MKREPSESEIEAVRLGLKSFNDDAVGPDGHTPLNLLELDEKGEVIAGLLGGTYWGWMYVDTLWVREDHRRRGLGSRLLCEAEDEARRRGCHHVHLDTMSWQAPDFYIKHGYRLIATLPDIPRGHRKLQMIKALS